jgi:type III secretion protein U
MSGSRTEQPTPRRLREARRRGEIPVSHQLTAATSLLAGVAALAATSPWLARVLAREMAASLAQAVGSPGDAWPALLRALTLFGRAALPLGAAVSLGALVAGTLQTRGLFSLETVRPRFDRLHVGKGLVRLVSGERLLATALETAKAATALSLAWRLVSSSVRDMAASPARDVSAMPRLLRAIVLKIALPLGAVLLAFGALELTLAVRRHRKRLMMSREEVARERREEEGDPRLDVERRRLHRALAAAVPLRRATCLVVNPTHVAVALHHARGAEDAPVVVAKGMGDAAARLRVGARRAGVPIVHDAALARALFRLAEVGDEIPEELYEAAAAILVHVHGLPVEPRKAAKGESEP